MKNNGILSFSAHDKNFLKEKYPQYMDGIQFFAYADTDCYWETFNINEMIDVAQKTGFTVLECKRGLVYKKDDGPILHCVCRK